MAELSALFVNDPLGFVVSSIFMFSVCLSRVGYGTSSVTILLILQAKKLTLSMKKKHLNTDIFKSKFF